MAAPSIQRRLARPPVNRSGHAQPQSPPPLLLLLLLALCTLLVRVSAHTEGPACEERTAVSTSDPFLCCPSVEYALEANPRGTGPLCTRCRFDRYPCADADGGCCHVDDECAHDAALGPVCMGAGAQGGAPSNRSGTDPRRDRAPSGTSAQNGPNALMLFFGLVFAAVGLVLALLCCGEGPCTRRSAAVAGASASSDPSASASGNSDMSIEPSARRSTQQSRKRQEPSAEMQPLFHAAQLDTSDDVALQLDADAYPSPADADADAPP